MINDVEKIIKEGLNDPNKAFPEIKTLASDKNWEKREDAATALVEISKKKADAFLEEMSKWSENKDENIRRTSTESLRYLARTEPISILPILEKVNKDESLYVKKAVAHILREMSKKRSDLVYDLCGKWTEFKNKNTNWIIRDGIKKLTKEQQEKLKSL